MFEVLEGLVSSLYVSACVDSWGYIIRQESCKDRILSVVRSEIEAILYVHKVGDLWCSINWLYFCFGIQQVIAYHFCIHSSGFFRLLVNQEGDHHLPRDRRC